MPDGARPTEGKVREALFSIWGEQVVDSRFLDLFAGSGGVGLEALSRGAREVCFVEAKRPSAEMLQTNARLLEETGWRVVVGNLPRALDRLAGRFDLIFVDPPYEFAEYEKVLDAVQSLLATDGEVAVEASVRGALPESVGKLERVGEREYGETVVGFYRGVGV